MFVERHETVGPHRRRSLGPARALLAAALAFACVPARAQPALLGPMLGAARLQTLLQGFVDRAYLKAFRHLGDERDFDHGHLLFASSEPGAAPVAILYHTQELAFYAPPRSGYEWLDPEGRNWIQWLSDGRVENASRYLSRVMPPLPLDPAQLAVHHTILAEMLDPAPFGARDRLVSRQVVFSKAPCPARVDPASMLRVRVPGGTAVCLALSQY